MEGKEKLLIPLPFLSLSFIPKKGASDDENKKINWIAWEVVTKLKEMGGLWVGCLDSTNMTFLAK